VDFNCIITAMPLLWNNSFAEVQEFLGVSHQTIYKLMKEGLPSHNIGKKRALLKEDLVRWTREHRRGGMAQGRSPLAVASG